MGTSTSASTPGHHRPSRLTRPTRVPRPSQRSEALPEEPELQRGLSNRHLQLIAIGGAIGTGMFMGSSSTIHLAGPSIILVYTVIGVFMYFMMRALGEMLLSNLKYKSFRDIAEDMLGPWAGFISGWTYWFSWIVAAMGDMAAITGYAQYWWPNIARWVPATVLVLVLLLLNIIAVKFFGEAEFWFALIKLVAIAILLLVAIWLVATKFVSPSGEMATVSNLWNDGGFFPNGINGFLAGFQIAFFAFVGIELVGTAAAETKDPTTTLPKAINAIPVRLALFYVLALAAIMCVVPWRSVVPGVSPFVTVFGMAGFTAAAGVMNFVLLTAAASSDNSGLYSTSRMLYGLAHDGQANQIFGKLSRRRVPQNALLLSCIILLCGVSFLYMSDSIMESFALVTTVAALMFLFTWSLIMVCYLVYRKRWPELHEKSIYKMPGGVPMAWAVLGFYLFSLVVLCLDPVTRKAVMVTPVWFILIAVMYFAHKRRAAKQNGLVTKSSVEEAQPHHEDGLDS